jgi:hypothetical protein
LGLYKQALAEVVAGVLHVPRRQTAKLIATVMSVVAVESRGDSSAFDALSGAASPLLQCVVASCAPRTRSAMAPSPAMLMECSRELQASKAELLKRGGPMPGRCRAAAVPPC